MHWLLRSNGHLNLQVFLLFQLRRTFCISLDYARLTSMPRFLYPLVHSSQLLIAFWSTLFFGETLRPMFLMASSW